jgi:hypothetical protein
MQRHQDARCEKTGRRQGNLFFCWTGRLRREGEEPGKPRPGGAGVRAPALPHVAHRATASGPRPMRNFFLLAVACASSCFAVTCGGGTHASPGRHEKRAVPKSPHKWGGALLTPAAVGYRALRGGYEVCCRRALYSLHHVALLCMLLTRRAFPSAGPTAAAFRSAHVRRGGDGVRVAPRALWSNCCRQTTCFKHLPFQATLLKVGGFMV